MKGYGDVVPKTVFGKLIVSVCALLPIGLFGVPLTVIASGLIEELQTDNKDLQDQLKRFLGKKLKKPTTPATSASPGSLSSNPISKRGSAFSEISEFEDHELRNRNSLLIPNLPKKPNGDVKYLLKLLNDDEEEINFFDTKLLSCMIEFNISLSGLFIPYSNEELNFEMKKVKKLGGITSVKILKKIIDENEYKMKDVHRLKKSIEKMIEYWKFNQLNFEDFKILDLELNENDEIKKDVKKIYKENQELIIEEIWKMIQKDELKIEFRNLISKKVIENINKQKLNIFKDLMKVTKDVIKNVLENWSLDAELTFKEEINEIIDHYLIKSLENLPSWKKRIEKLNSNIKIK